MIKKFSKITRWIWFKKSWTKNVSQQFNYTFSKLFQITKKSKVFTTGLNTGEFFFHRLNEVCMQKKILIIIIIIGQLLHLKWDFTVWFFLPSSRKVSKQLQKVDMPQSTPGKKLFWINMQSKLFKIRDILFNN